MNNINYNAFFVSADGGLVRYVSGTELLFEVRVPPGKVPVREYLDLCPPGAAIEYEDQLVLFDPPSHFGLIEYEDAFESGANPDFRPSSARRNEIQMGLIMQRLQKVDHLEARIRSYERARPVAAPEPAPAAAHQEAEPQAQAVQQEPVDETAAEL